MGKIQVNVLRNPISGSNFPNYAHYTGVHFKDAITGDLCWVYDDDSASNSYLWTQQAQDVAPSQVAVSNNTYLGFIASTQDSEGNIHFLCYYSYGLSYIKCTITRSGGHVTGWSFGTYISLPTMTSALGSSVWAGTISVVRNGSNAERVMIVCLDCDDATNYCAAVCHSSISPTATSSFLSLSGTASTWTKFPTQTASANVSAAYCFNGSISQYGTSGNVFVDAGAASRGDVGDYSCSLVGYRAIASGANWSVDTANPCVLATETDETLCGNSCTDANSNAYFLWTKRVGSGDVTVGLSQVASDGTFTADWLSTTSTMGGELKGFPVVCSDGTVILALAPGDTGSSTTFPEIKVYSDGSWYSYYGASTRWTTAVLGWIDHGSRDVVDGLVWNIGASAYPAQLSLGSIHLRTATVANVYYDNYSLPVYSGTATISPTYATAVPDPNNDMHIVIVAQKSTSASGGTITFPDGWTKEGEILGAGGYASQADDTGNVDIAMGVKNSVVGTESGSIDVTLGSYNTAWAMQVRCNKGGSGPWNYASTTGSDVSGGNLSVVYDSAIDLEPGDLLLIGWAQATDVTTPSQFTSQAISADGITFGEVTVLAEPDSSTGADIGGWVGYVRVLSGSGNVVPTFSAVAGGTTTNVRGGSVLLRLRGLVASASSVVVSSAWSNLIDGYMLVDENWNSLVRVQVLLEGSWVDLVP
jgi:hypothetical protein